MRPVGGASSTTASYTRAPLLRELRSTASYTLPVSSTSRSPGAIVVAKSMTPNRSSSLAGAGAEPVVEREVLQHRGLGVDRERVDVAAVVGPWRDAALLVRQRGTSKSCAMPWRPSTSQSSTCLPWEASARASAAATVVLPVPPLPVTTCSCTLGQSRLGSLLTRTERTGDRGTGVPGDCGSGSGLPRPSSGPGPASAEPGILDTLSSLTHGRRHVAARSSPPHQQESRCREVYPQRRPPISETMARPGLHPVFERYLGLVVEGDRTAALRLVVAQVEDGAELPTPC